jgi:DNA-binding MarR family transcriptional regulator
MARAGASHDFGIELGLAFAAFVEWLNDEMAKSGYDDLGPGFGYVFRALAGAPVTLSQLAASLGMTTQGAAKIVAAMEQARYVVRTPDPRDGRARLIDLDDRGRHAAARARSLHARFATELAGEIGAEAVASLRAGLQAIMAVRPGDPADRLLRPL